MGIGELSGKPDKMLGVTFSGLASHPGGVAIERFHSRDQRPYLFNETKESFCITKELNSHRTDLVHQHGRLFIVLIHQYGRQDVT